MNDNVNRNDGDFDSLLLDFRTLPPEQRDRAVRRVIARARDYRSQEIRDLFRSVYVWIKRRAAIAKLRRLDDRMLKDIGITRGEIESAVQGFPNERMREPRGSVPSCGGARAPAREFDKAA